LLRRRWRGRWAMDIEDDVERLAEDCGFDEEEGHCHLAGTEYCDFRCPFSRPGDVGPSVPSEGSAVPGDELPF
jgi:hypothetical protein